MKVPSLHVGRKIRAYRKRRELSLNEVSRLTGIAASTLSAIELDKSSPTLATLLKLAAAFDMKVGPFVDEVLYAEAVLCRAGEGVPLETGADRTKALSLTNGLLLNRMDADLVELLPKAGPVSPGPKDKDRFLCCLKGEVSVMVNRESYVLREGDSLYIMPDAEASIDGSSKTSCVLVVTSGTRD
jgi:transcriptional regulator with XRE-family HTH domain